VNGRQERLAATDQMNDFEAVSRLHHSRQPLGPGKDFQIALNGHAVRRQAEMRKQAGYTKARWHLASFSINHNVDSRGHFSYNAAGASRRLVLSRKRSSP